MELILKYFNGLTDTQIKQYRGLAEVYRFWNEKINVISRSDIDNLYLKHVLHSLAIARYACFTDGTKILDIGTGGGFPGIPLAIYFPEVQFTLIDSIGKKIKVVKEVSKSLGLTNVQGIISRVENSNEKFDFVVARAVAPLSRLINWSGKNVSGISKNELHNGLLALKGGDLTRETDISNPVKIVEISDYFQEPFFKTKKLIHVHI